MFLNNASYFCITTLVEIALHTRLQNYAPKLYKHYVTNYSKALLFYTKIQVQQKI